MVAGGRVGWHQSCVRHGGARDGGAGSKPDRRGHRQPIGEDNGGEPRGIDAGKSDNEGVALRSKAASVISLPTRYGGYAGKTARDVERDPPTG
jgi:hypothetical protein